MLINSNAISGNTYAISLTTWESLRQFLWSQKDVFDDWFDLNLTPASLLITAYILPFRLTSITSKGFSLTSNLYMGYKNLKDVRYTTPSGSEITFNISNCYWLNRSSGDLVETEIASYTFLGNGYINEFNELPTISSYRLFAPFFGYINIDFIEYIKGFNVKYFCDFSTGTLSINIYSNLGTPTLNFIEGKLIYTESREVGIPLIISGGDRGAMREKQMGIVNAVGSTISGVGQTVAMLAPSLTAKGVGLGLSMLGVGVSATSSASSSKVSNSGSQTYVKNTERNVNTGRQITASTQTTEYSPSEISRESNYEGTRTFTNIGASINSAVNSLHDLSQISANVLSTNVFQVFDIWNSPMEMFIEKVTPTFAINYDALAEYSGRPARDVYKLKYLRGYVNVGMIHLNIDCTHSELVEISELLESGVIINQSKLQAPDVVVNPYE